jgi:hypothetical protein
MLITAALMILVILQEIGARYYETGQISKTHVSTVRTTDYVHSPLAIGLAWGGAGTALLALVAGLIWQMPLIAGLAILGVFSLFRVTLTALTLTAARLSSPVRLRQAMAHPAISNAKLAFHFSGVDYQDPSHFYIWESDLKDVDENCVLLLRERKHLDCERKRASTPALLLQNEASIREYSLKSSTTLKAIFYANNGMKNTSFIRALPNAEHVQLLHGDSDKPPSFSPLTKMFDHVFTAGQMGIDRYAHNGVDIPANKFKIVGRPQVRAISDETHSTTDAPRRVVYMPTWRGFFADTQFSSLGQASEAIDKILDADHPTALHFKAHPLSYKDPQWPQLERDIRAALGKKRTNGNTGVFREDATSPFDLYNEADLIVTDISSVMNDFLYSGKPFLAILPPGFNVEKDSSRFPSLEAGYQVASSLENLTEQFEAAIGDDLLRAKRESVRLYAFGDYGRTPGKAFSEACLALLNNNCDVSLSQDKKG